MAAPSRSIPPMPSPLARYLPFLDLRGWRVADLRGDLTAAAAVTVLSIPQGLAYAMMAGLPPAVGLYASMVPAIVGGLFRSSRHVVAGPTNALSLLVGGAIAAVVASTGADPVTIAGTLALMVGVIQLLAGLLRLGAFVDYISSPVVLGYITGAAVLIALGQLPNLTQTHMSGAHLPGQLLSWVRGLDAVNPMAVALGLGTTAAIVLLRLLNRRVPGALLAMVGGIVLEYTFGLHDRGMRVIADIAPVRGQLPPWTWPSLSHVELLVPAAVAATVLSLVESSSVARAIAARTGDRIEPDTEFAGQGLSNLAAAFTGGYPTSGSLGRSMANWQSGARTRLAGPLGGVLVLLVVLFGGPVVDHTPVASLAGILLVLGWDLIDWKRIRLTMRAGRGDALAFVTTLVGTWVLELDKAIYVGVVISLVLFLRRARLITVVELAFDDDLRLREVAVADDAPGANETAPPVGSFHRCCAIRVLHVEGSLFFGAASELQASLDEAVEDPSVRVLVLRLKRCQGLDMTTAEVLRSCAEGLRAQGRHLVLVGMRAPVMARMEAFGLPKAVGAENLFPTEERWFVAMDRALTRARELAGEHEVGCPVERYLEGR
jgi:SulP family sulfate permease